jgi:hypothetical protein
MASCGRGNHGPSGAPIVDVDDVGPNTAGVVALLRSGWGEAVPFIGLSSRADVGVIATSFDAVAVLRKPLNAGLLLTTVERILRPTPPASEFS